MSAVFYHNEEQSQLVEQAKESIASQLSRETVYSYQQFYLAEEHHQKYKLQRQPPTSRVRYANKRRAFSSWECKGV